MPLLTTPASWACLPAEPASTPRWRRDLNKASFLGSGGKLAEAYAELMGRMWRGKMTAFPPTHFKQVLLHKW